MRGILMSLTVVHCWLTKPAALRWHGCYCNCSNKANKKMTFTCTRTYSEGLYQPPLIVMNFGGRYLWPRGGYRLIGKGPSRSTFVLNLELLGLGLLGWAAVKVPPPSSPAALPGRAHLSRQRLQPRPRLRCGGPGEGAALVIIKCN